MSITDSRRCALPGCYVVIESEPDGRPQRKYCTAAHRAIARQMRREGIHRSASAPPLPLPTPPLPLPPLAPLPGVAQRRRQLATAAARRCRAVAVLGSAGLLVTGGGLMAASSPLGAPSAAVAESPWLASTPQAEQQWAQQAQVTLASLDSQLQVVTKTQQSWEALPVTKRPDPVPAPVRALTSRRTLLEQQRAALASELATWKSMQDTNQRLADTEDHVSSLDEAIDDVPQHRQLSPAETSAAQQLTAQRDMRQRQKDSQQDELDNLRQDLHQAMATPLPDDDNATKSITSMVDQLIEHPDSNNTSRDPNPLGGQPTRPEVISPKDRDDKDRQDIGNGAPPNPGRSRPEVPQSPEILAAGPDIPGSAPTGNPLGDAAKTV
ncbi:MAG: hypothetical protein QOC83_3882, partial [Pseudonocardiales bacterium]|nr:hypothetical protein [Pseudonocardiales bacterium]